MELEWDQWKLIEKAALGSIEAAEMLGEGYLNGAFEGKIRPDKAKKWSSYAAKHGSVRAAEILRILEERERDGLREEITEEIIIEERTEEGE